MENRIRDVDIKIEKISPHLLKTKIDVGPEFFSVVYNQTLDLYRKKALLAGIKLNKIPQDYIEKNYKNEIESNLKNFLLKHTILEFLLDEIRLKKIPVTNYPRLTGISLNNNTQISFMFDISVSDKIELKEWKNFIFRPPKRKRYKDLDKQVLLFLKREATLFKKQDQTTIYEKDWVCFEAQLLDENLDPALGQYKSSFWIKINAHPITNPFQTSLIGKKIGESFISQNLQLDDFLPNHNYSFLITIKTITKGRHLCLDAFKTTFKLKSKQDVQKKLIEVFSYRNDLSQRKSTIEDLFHLLLSKHRFEVPKHFILRRQEDIILSLQHHPDYHVYKQEKNFLNQIEQLAEKQLKEEILIDQISYNENVKVEEKDIQNYLYLFNTHRLKEFVYFKPMFDKIDETTPPIHNGILKNATLREKTLNYIIHMLTR